MNKPKCTCFRDALAKSEQMIIQISAGAVKGCNTARTVYGVCDDATPYLAMTLVTFALTSLVGLKYPEDDKSFDVQRNAMFEEILSTLVADVRQRKEELEAYMERGVLSAGELQ